MFKSILKGTAEILGRVADTIPTTPEEKVIEQLKQAVIKNKELQMVLHEFTLKYHTGIINISVRPIVEKDTLNVVGWQAFLGKSLFYRAKGLNDIYDYFYEGTYTTDNKKIAEYVKKVEDILNLEY